MTVNQKLAVLRESMKKHGVNAMIVPSADPHISEGLPERWKQRKYFSGFTGSAGTLVVTEKESGLWTDGRYFVQAERELKDSEIELYRIAVKDVPTITEFLEDKLSSGDVLGIDGSITAASLYEDYEKSAQKKGFSIKSVPCIDESWENRPVLPLRDIYVHELKYTGLSAKEKADMLRKKLKEQNADSMVVTALPSIIWLLNIRGKNVPSNPTIVSYCVVTADDIIFFADCDKLEPDVQNHFEENEITLKGYDDIVPFINGYCKDSTFLVDKASTNYNLLSALKENENIRIVYGSDPVLMLKAVKSEFELKNIDNAHIKDGCAMVRFQMRLEDMLKNNQTFTELDIVHMIKEERSKEEGYIAESFAAIAAYGANAAMMHYSPTEDKNSVVEKKGFLLLDNGGHFLDGTTDTTRTYAVGPLTELEKKYYTIVLKAHVDLAKAWFLEGNTGGSVDIMARQPIWKLGLNYRCGTGHGVGYLNNIHEGPQNIRPQNPVVLVPGMTVTDEPGIYEENVVGVRTENGMVCVEKKETEYGRFLGFEPLTYVPYDLTPVIPELLDSEEIEWIDCYHKKVYNKLAPRLTDEQKEWLKIKTRPLKEQINC